MGNRAPRLALPPRQMARGGGQQRYGSPVTTNLRPQVIPRRSGVFALRGAEHNDAVSPSGVGFDIACGNKAVRLDIPPQRLGQPGRDQFWRWPKQL